MPDLIEAFGLENSRLMAQSVTRRGQVSSLGIRARSISHGERWRMSLSIPRSSRAHQCFSEVARQLVDAQMTALAVTHLVDLLLTAGWGPSASRYRAEVNDPPLGGEA